MAVLNFKKSKLNNAGMTLVELLIAMAILAVASTAILAAFVNSFRYSVRGRELQQTTVLANTIIENCKAYSKEDIETQMGNGTFLSGMPGAAVEVGDIFYMQDIPLDNKLYDISLKMASRGINGSATTTHNIMLSTSMNSYKDAVFLPQDATYTDGSNTWTAAQLDNMAYLLARQIIVAGMETETETDPNGALTKVTLTPDYVAASFNDSSNPDYSKNSNNLEMSRTTSIVIDTDATLGEYVKVFIQYSFDLDGGIYYYKGVDATGAEYTYEWPIGSNGNIGTYEFLIYSNSGTNDASHPTQLENVYFFYYPAYHQNGSLMSGAMYPFVSDVISVSNKIASHPTPINLYVMKQKNPAYTETKLSNFETRYSTEIFNVGTAQTVVYHNYKDNLGTAQIGGFFDASGNVIDDGTAFGITGIDPNNWFADSLDVKDSMIVEDSKILMYDLEVTIYNAGAYDDVTKTIVAGSEPVLTMKGTTLDW